MDVPRNGRVAMVTSFSMATYKKWGNNIKVGFVNCRCVVGVWWWLVVVWMAVSRCAIRVRVFRIHKDVDKGLVAFSHWDLTLTLVFSLLTSKICPFETNFAYLDWKLIVHFNLQTIGGCVVIFESQGEWPTPGKPQGVKRSFPCWWIPTSPSCAFLESDIICLVVPLPPFFWVSIEISLFCQTRLLVNIFYDLVEMELCCKLQKLNCILAAMVLIAEFF